MDFAQAESIFWALEDSRLAGEITHSDYLERLDALRVVDDAGRTWLLQRYSGLWHVWDGAQWVAATPDSPSAPIAEMSDDAALITQMAPTVSVSPPPPVEEAPVVDPLAETATQAATPAIKAERQKRQKRQRTSRTRTPLGLGGLSLRWAIWLVVWLVAARVLKAAMWRPPWWAYLALMLLAGGSAWLMLKVMAGRIEPRATTGASGGAV